MRCLKGIVHQILNKDEGFSWISKPCRKGRKNELNEKNFLKDFIFLKKVLRRAFFYHCINLPACIMLSHLMSFIHTTWAFIAFETLMLKKTCLHQIIWHHIQFYCNDASLLSSNMLTQCCLLLNSVYCPSVLIEGTTSLSDVFITSL